jgi:hemolysin D
MNAPLSRLPALSRQFRLATPVRLTELSARLKALTDHEDKEFLPAALEIRDKPASPYAVAFVWIVAAGFLAGLLWSCLARLDIFAVASGRVQVSGRSKVVQPFEPGTVRAVLVSNGAHVKAGDLLIELDPTEAAADLNAKSSQLESAEAELARRAATIEAVRHQRIATDPEFPASVSSPIRQRELAVMSAELAQYSASRESTLAQIAEKTAQQDRLTASIAAKQRLMALVKERAAMRETLAAKSAGTRAAVIDAIQMVEETAASLASDQGQLAEALAGARSLERKLDQLTQEMIAQQVQKATDASQRRDALRQDVIKATLKLDRTRLATPIDGTVQQLAVTTLGQVVAAGQPLLVVVPADGPIEVEALVQNKDIGFIRPGQEATVKIDAFPFTRYGTLEGRVVRVSRDAIDERDASGSTDTLSVARGSGVSQVSGTPKTQNLVFPVSVELRRTTIMGDAGDVRLSPGMTTTVEIRTGERRVIDYLLAPIRETVGQAGHER